MKYSLITASLFAFALAAPAHAAEPLAFYPSQGWAVNAGCAASTVYNNGYRVTLDGQNSILIDFQQAVFTSGNSYPVTLSLPGQEGINVSAEAESAEILNFDISPYQGLAKAMLNARSFDTNIEGNAFRFFTTGLSQKSSDLYSCLNKPVDNTPIPTEPYMPPQITRAVALPEPVFEKPAPKAAPVDVSRYANEISGLQQQLIALRSENNMLRRAHAEPAVVPVAMDTTRYTNEIAALKKRVEELQSDNTRLQNQPAPTPVVTASVDNSRYQDEIAMLKDQLTDLRAETLDLKQAGYGESSLGTADWNLEKATMRFQEAERQLKEMGTKLQRERSKSELEKRELEALLFDPQIADQRQIAELATLEDKVAELEEDLINQRLRYEERIRLLEN